MQAEFINLEERARTAISLGESHFREFKSVFHGAPAQKQTRDSKSVCKDIAEALVAFANADGGELLVGVEDDGEITGIETAAAPYLALLEKAPTTHVHHRTPLPPVRKASLTLDGHSVLYFSVQKSTSFVHLTSDGRCVQRRDLETVPIPPEEIIFSRKEQQSRGYDRQFLDDATAGDLNTGELKPRRICRSRAEIAARGASSLRKRTEPLASATANPHHKSCGQRVALRSAIQRQVRPDRYRQYSRTDRTRLG